MTLGHRLTISPLALRWDRLAKGLPTGHTRGVSDTPEATDRATAAPQKSPLKRRVLIGAGVLVGIVLIYYIGGATIPRWWAQRIGDQVNGSITAGIALGLFYGIVFTFLPLFVLTFALRRRRSWRARAWLVGLAVLLALPNLFTLGIVIGNSSAAHAGERTLDVRAPDFRGATLAGAIIGAAAVVGLRYLLMSRRRAKEREASLRGELRSRDDATVVAPTDPES